MKKWYLFVFLLLLGKTISAQSLYELTFETGGINYKCFLVYFNEQDSYMRVAYTYKGKYNVVNVKYTSVAGKEDGYDYFVMMGSEPKFITDKAEGQSYNPDHFIWIWNDANKNTLPYVTDDPNFDESKMHQCTSYKDVNPKDLTDTYLNEFFGTAEPEYASLRKMKNASTNTNNNTNANTNTSGAKSKMHLVLCINTEIGDIGQSCSVDQKAMEVEFREIAKAVGMPFEKYIVNGENFTKANALETLNKLKVGANDVVVFYYSGHGFRWSDQTDTYPQLDMRYSSYTAIGENTSLPLSQVYNTIVQKGGRLNLVLSDCCNSDVGRNQMTSQTFMAGRSFQGAEIEKLKGLFLNSSGSLLVTGSSPGEYSWCSINGGFFTLSFIQALKEEIGYMRNNDPSWDNIVSNAVKSTQYKAKSCNNCKPQNPVYYSKVAKK
ncbi:MAG: caspase family protein [Thermonemataceae bacterium]|nr:caspase family protein [Thermonemataceae bacterium]